MRPLPSLTALRAFEATARLGSVTRAAEELSVTHAAVSHQLRALEDWMGTPLFRRGHRRILPNEAGAALLPVVTDAFDRIAARAAEIRGSKGRRTFTISSAPSIAYRWIVPRLAEFSARHPEVDVRLENSTRIVDLLREEIDVAIRYSARPWPGLECRRLLPGHALPMASPALLDRHGLSRTALPLPPATIACLPLQHEEKRDHWRRWFVDGGLPDADVGSGAVFHDTGVMLDLALAGQGVVLGRVALAHDLLRQGLLVALSDRPAGDGSDYWLCNTPARDSDAVVGAFRDFVLAEAQATAEAYAAR